MTVRKFTWAEYVVKKEEGVRSNSATGKNKKCYFKEK